MCGICGFNWEDNLLIKNMCKVLEHRGPDNSGTYISKHISLGHQRLSIIDISKRGKQPMTNKEGNLVITYNGEIYNYKDIKKDLQKKGYKFISETDTEVILYAYQEYGPNCVKIFNGMFAFAIWDTNKKELFIARDRLGIKPLFYYWDGKKFIFSSEIKAIIEHEIEKKFNKKTLNQFLVYSYPVNNETLIKDIYDLQPASYLIYKSGGIRIKNYWQLHSGIKEKPLDFYIENLRKELFSSVSKRLMSDVPLGASLSGGIDSSAIVAIMSKLKKEPVKTFTIGFGDPSDEFKMAKIVAEHCKTDHTEIIIDHDEVTSAFPRIVWHMETPFGRPATLPTYFLAKETKNKVTVSLVGEGSDEIFAGYDRYYPYTKNNNMSKKERIDNICSGYFVKEEEQRGAFSKELLSHAPLMLNPEHSLGPYLDKYPKNEWVNAVLLYEIKTELTGVQLNRVDRNSMAHAVEMRVPFLDHELVEFAMTIPSKYKWFKGEKKYVLQRSMVNLLPKKIIKRKKLPFNVPLGSYSKKSFVYAAESILLNTPKRDFINYKYFSKLIKKIKDGSNIEDNSLRQLLFITSLELWYKMFIEGEAVDKIKI